MTRIQLIRNLNKTRITSLMCFHYEVINEKRDTYGHEIYVMVLNQLQRPIYLLRYRLDLDFLASYWEIGSIRMYAQDLKDFENATKRISNKDSRG